jgi:hypothetical protein
MSTSTINNNNHCTINNYYMNVRPDDNIETFRLVIGYPDYLISNFGRLISLKHKEGIFKNYTITKKGYFRVGLSKNRKEKKFLVSRLVALAFIPNPENKPIVDHIDETNKLNNHISNLRWASIPQNGQNRGKPNNNTSGYKGVCFYKKSNKFSAQIKIDGKKKHLGLFSTAEEASEAYEAAAKTVHGEFYYKNSIKIQ